jgi:hypothetical protein
LAVQGVDDGQSLDDPADRREAEGVESGIVGQIDEELRRTGIRAGGGERHHAVQVRLADGIVRDGWLPGLAAARVPGQPKLRDESWDHTKEPRLVVEARAEELIQAIGATRRPGAVHDDGDRTAVGRERDEKAVGCLLRECRARAGERCRKRDDRTAAGPYDQAAAAPCKRPGKAASWRSCQRVSVS